MGSGLQRGLWGWEGVVKGVFGVGVRCSGFRLCGDDASVSYNYKNFHYVRINYVMTDYITVHGSLTSCDVTQSNECSGRPHADNTDKKNSLSVY